MFSNGRVTNKWNRTSSTRFSDFCKHRIRAPVVFMLLPSLRLSNEHLLSDIHSRFSLIQSHFVKLVQLAKFDKISNAWQFKELVIV